MSAPRKQYGKEESSVYVESARGARRVLRIMDGDQLLVEFDLTGWPDERADAFERACRLEHTRRCEEIIHGKKK